MRPELISGGNAAKSNTVSSSVRRDRGGDLGSHVKTITAVVTTWTTIATSKPSGRGWPEHWRARSLCPEIWSATRIPGRPVNNDMHHMPRLHHCQQPSDSSNVG
jgi:hypothetical protein